ncbi:hypothetical protein AGMMS49942_13330 [Spirochaetia bacterium]|nr:hypothetical protein AGMMS49942_13330 [Spirochaetia bacterium]
MGGMYPNDQIISMFGENIRWPGMDVNGKFTNGDFDDPEQKPSFMPAEIINLILDNLEEAIKAAGNTPNNTEITQLAAILALKAPLVSPVFTGAPKVPSKATAATSDGTLIATEAQVALKADLASSALTGVPTAPTAAVKTNTAQLATCEFAQNAGHGIGEIVVQYPPVSGIPITPPLPGDLYGGTWSEVTSYYAGRFFRAAGGNAAAFGTAQEDRIRNITGTVSAGGTNNQTSSGVFTKSNSSADPLNGGTSWACWILDFDASRVVSTGVENNPVNYAIRLWQRIA